VKSVGVTPVCLRKELVSLKPNIKSDPHDRQFRLAHWHLICGALVSVYEATGVAHMMAMFVKRLGLRKISPPRARFLKHSPAQRITPIAETL